MLSNQIPRKIIKGLLDLYSWLRREVTQNFERGYEKWATLFRLVWISSRCCQGRAEVLLRWWQDEKNLRPRMNVFCFTITI